MNTEMYEKIVTDRLVFGVPISKIAKEVERNTTSVRCVVDAFQGVRDDNWERCAFLIDKEKIPLSVFNWAAEKLGKQLPQALETVYDERKARHREYKAQRQMCQKNESAPELTTPAIELAATPEHSQMPQPIESEKKGSLDLYFIKLLEAVNRQNELLEQLYDVVIPKWTGDIKDNINCNSDVISQSLKRIDDKLEAIKINVRKRGL